MKRFNYFICSLIGNILLLSLFIAVRHPSVRDYAKQRSGMGQRCGPSDHVKLVPSVSGNSPSVSIWAQIESTNYGQFVANLRAVDCPGWLIRDIIVAEVDKLYKGKEISAVPGFDPWQPAYMKHQALDMEHDRLDALRSEKRALVKAVIGYEWQDNAERIWNQNLPTVLADGFLPDDKAAWLWDMRELFDRKAFGIREAAHFVLLDDDRAKLANLFQKYQAALAEVLDAEQINELNLRCQQRFFAWNDVHFDNVGISVAQYRAFVLATRNIKDIARTDFVPEARISEAMQARRKEEIRSEASRILHASQFATFERAQDFHFRELLDFGRQNELPISASLMLYQSRQKADAQLVEIQNDVNLSPDERGMALAVLRAATIDAIAPTLGANLQRYLSGPGNWLDNLTTTPAKEKL